MQTVCCALCVCCVMCVVCVKLPAYGLVADGRRSDGKRDLDKTIVEPIYRRKQVWYAGWWCVASSHRLTAFQRARLILSLSLCLPCIGMRCTQRQWLSGSYRTDLHDFFFLPSYVRCTSSYCRTLCAKVVVGWRKNDEERMNTEEVKKKNWTKRCARCFGLNKNNRFLCVGSLVYFIIMHELGHGRWWAWEHALFSLVFFF